MGHHHHHHHHSLDAQSNSTRLFWAVVVNLILSLVQFLVGLVTGSLSLIADSIHNLGDAGSLIIAYFAQKISSWSPTTKMTYGYGRAEVLGALINSILLIGTSLFLIYEAYERAISSKPIEGLWVIAVGFLALIIDLFTALLTYKGSKNSVNMKAAFLHNLSDALASVGVIISGVFAMYFDIYWVDALATFGISVFILIHSYPLLKSCFKILMQSVPDDIDVGQLKETVMSIEKVEEFYHLHVWQLQDSKKMLEAHVKVNVLSLSEQEEVKTSIKRVLKESFGIEHATLEVSSS